MVSTMILFSVTMMLFGAVTSLGLFRPPNREFSSLPEDELSIVGGHETTIEKHPYHVLFFSTESELWCGGFIISENYIVTAAHCVLLSQRYNMRLPTAKVRAGSTFRKEGGIILDLAELIPHPNYTHSTIDCDIGLLKTAAPIKFSKTVQPIKLPEIGRPVADNSLITVTGWGYTKPRQENLDIFPNHLMAVDVPVVNNEKCRELYNGRANITENMLCAGDMKSGGKDSCNGDSGGPASQDGVAVGVVSFGVGCARKDYPGVYARIAAPAVRDFIKKHTGI